MSTSDDNTAKPSEGSLTSRFALSQPKDPPQPLSSLQSIVEGTEWSRDKKRHFDSQVAEATLMLDYAKANCAATPDRRNVDDDTIGMIARAQDLTNRSEPPTAAERAQFDAAYRDLATLICPVTAETLKATSENYSLRSLLTPRPRPIAIIWSRKLSAWTIAIVAIAIMGTYFDQMNGPIPALSDRNPAVFPTMPQLAQMLCQILLPFTYGAIGACVALLKSCQRFIYTRQFDPRHIPEYYNRMILGAVSGGIIVILITQVTGEDGAEIKLSAAALGFIAGYNSDLLFAAIERISTALLPRVGLSSVQQQPAVAVQDVSLKDVLKLHEGASDPKDKKVYSQLIEKMRDRI